MGIYDLARDNALEGGRLHDLSVEAREEAIDLKYGLLEEAAGQLAISLVRDESAHPLLSQRAAKHRGQGDLAVEDLLTEEEKLRLPEATTIVEAIARSIQVEVPVTYGKMTRKQKKEFRRRHPAPAPTGQHVRTAAVL